MVLEDFDLVGLESGGQNAKNFRPDGGAVAGAVTARNGLTATAALAEAELGAEIDKPFLRISCVFRERLQERGIVEVVTAFHRVLIEDFRTVVRDAACDLLLRARCVHASRGEVGVAADVGRTTTLEPASLAMMAAERPAPPEPTTTTSKDWASETAVKRASTVPATRVFLYYLSSSREKNGFLENISPQGCECHRDKLLWGFSCEMNPLLYLGDRASQNVCRRGGTAEVMYLGDGLFFWADASSDCICRS